jgi:hypothetical protein
MIERKPIQTHLMPMPSATPTTSWNLLGKSLNAMPFRCTTRLFEVIGAATSQWNPNSDLSSYIDLCGPCFQWAESRVVYALWNAPGHELAFASHSQVGSFRENCTASASVGLHHALWSYVDQESVCCQPGLYMAAWFLLSVRGWMMGSLKSH